MGLGIGAVTAAKMHTIEKFYATEIRRAAKDDKKDQTAALKEKAAEGIMGGEGGIGLVVAMNERQNTAKIEMVKELKACIGDIVIRRRPDSKTPDGTRIFGLPDLHMMEIKVYPTPEEQVIYEEMRKDAASKL